jgi:hypothetical protein
VVVSARIVRQKVALSRSAASKTVLPAGVRRAHRRCRGRLGQWCGFDPVDYFFVGFDRPLSEHLDADVNAVGVAPVAELDGVRLGVIHKFFSEVDHRFDEAGELGHNTSNSSASFLQNPSDGRATPRLNRASLYYYRNNLITNFRGRLLNGIFE